MKDIYITGDTHGFSYDFTKLIRPLMFLDRDDIVIVAGDFGGVWHKGRVSGYGETIPSAKDLANIKFNIPEYGPTVLFIDGNHENHKVLNSMTVTKKFGGKVHQITNNVYHLMRGEVFTIYDKVIFTMGGALSIDREVRTKNVSYWEEELIRQEDIENGLENLSKYDNKVDYVLTHTCPLKIAERLSALSKGTRNEFRMEAKYHDISTELLTTIQDKIQFKHWYFGHYHLDMPVDDKFTCIYQNLIKI